MNHVRSRGGETEVEPQAYVVNILQQWVNLKVAVNLTKSELHVCETISLCHIVNSSEGRIDPAKAETRSQWPVPTTKQQLQTLLAFAN